MRELIRRISLLGGVSVVRVLMRRRSLLWGVRGNSALEGGT